MIGCSDTVSGRASGNQSAPNSFNDCFLFCDGTSGCTGFTYSGVANGAGPGTCYFRNGTSEAFVANDTSHVGAIRVADYVPFVSTVSSLPSDALREITNSRVVNHNVCAIAGEALEEHVGSC